MADFQLMMQGADGESMCGPVLLQQAKGFKSPAGAPDIFSKTKMCKFHILGICTKGENCPFAHGKEELAPLPDLTRTKLCKNLINTGACKDPSCKYAHGKAELRPGKRSEKSGKPEQRRRGKSDPQEQGQGGRPRPGALSADSCSGEHGPKGRSYTADCVMQSGSGACFSPQMCYFSSPDGQMQTMSPMLTPSGQPVMFMVPVSPLTLQPQPNPQVSPMCSPLKEPQDSSIATQLAEACLEDSLSPTNSPRDHFYQMELDQRAQQMMSPMMYMAIMGQPGPQNDQCQSTVNTDEVKPLGESNANKVPEPNKADTISTKVMDRSTLLVKNTFLDFPTEKKGLRTVLSAEGRLDLMAEE